MSRYSSNPALESHHPRHQVTTWSRSDVSRRPVPELRRAPRTVLLRRPSFLIARCSRCRGGAHVHSDRFSRLSIWRQLVRALPIAGANSHAGTYIVSISLKISPLTWPRHHLFNKLLLLASWLVQICIVRFKPPSPVVPVQAYIPFDPSMGLSQISLDLRRAYAHTPRRTVVCSPWAERLDRTRSHVLRHSHRTRRSQTSRYPQTQPPNTPSLFPCTRSIMTAFSIY